MSSRVVDGRHIFRNAMLPVVTVIGLQTGLLLSGAILTETVFALPVLGRGSRGTDARDYPVLQGGSFVAAVFVVVGTCSSTSRTASSTWRVRVSLMSVAEPEQSPDRGHGRGGGLWRDAFRKLLCNPGAIVGFVLVGIFVGTAIFAPWLAPYDLASRI